MQTHKANLSRANANRTHEPGKSISNNHLHLPAGTLALLTTAIIRPSRHHPHRQLPPGIWHSSFLIPLYARRTNQLQ